MGTEANFPACNLRMAHISKYMISSDDFGSIEVYEFDSKESRDSRWKDLIAKDAIRVDEQDESGYYLVVIKIINHSDRWFNFWTRNGTATMISFDASGKENRIDARKRSLEAER